jgi:glycosyltransferase involved in cell wall biosynthesis
MERRMPVVATPPIATAEGDPLHGRVPDGPAARKYRIAVVNSHPVQYFAPLYAYLNRDERLEITALYCSDFSLRGGMDPGFRKPIRWDVDLLSGYRSRFLGRRAGTRTPRGFFSLVAPEIWSEVRSGQYDAVWLHGYNYAASVLAFLAAKSKGLPVLMRGETHIALSRPGWKRLVRDRILSLAYRFVDRFLAIGTSNRLYYRSLGVPPERIFDVPYTVDNDRFIAAGSLTAEERRKVREQYGLPQQEPVILYASKFMRRKHPDSVVRAAAILRDRGQKATLLMIGTGEMEGELRDLVRSSNLTNVIFGGFVNQADLPRVYGASDIFVLPSTDEPWGLIVNEVMCAGLPVVVGSRVGCVADLVREGINGRCVEAGDDESLARALEELVAQPARRRAMGKESLAIIRNWSYEQCRRGILAAIEGLQARRGPVARPVAMDR